MRSVGAAVVLVLMVLRTAVQSETTTETAIETTALRTCPDMSGCTGNCQPDYSYLYDGCPVCLCVDPICGWLVQCGPDEDCVLDYEAFLGAVCVPKYETTSETIETTSPRDCPDLSGCTGNNCSPDYWNLVDGCPTCLCGDPICGWLVQCGPDEDCVLTNEPPLYAVCVGKYGTTAETTAVTDIETNVPPGCSDLSWCSGYCNPDYSYIDPIDGCPACVCVTPSCGALWPEICGPDEICVDNRIKFGPFCIPKSSYATTTYSTTSADSTTTSCEPNDPPCLDYPGCSYISGDGCLRCYCFSCDYPVCPAGEQCIQYAKPIDNDCVPIIETTVATTAGTRPTRETTIETTTQTTTETTTPTTTVTTPDPCTGTPNTNRCTGSSILRWTYNSVTDKCKKFSYYGCTPSFNTFSSKKACRNSCKVCKTLDCEDNCYSSTKKNGCMKCICPCKGFKCPKGYECRLQEAEGGDKEPQPVCYPKPCPTQPPCNIKCMYGLKTDKNGCQLCECLKKPPPQK